MLKCLNITKQSVIVWESEIATSKDSSKIFLFFSATLVSIFVGEFSTEDFLDPVENIEIPPDSSGDASFVLPNCAF